MDRADRDVIHYYTRVMASKEYMDSMGNQHWPVSNSSYY